MNGCPTPSKVRYTDKKRAKRALVEVTGARGARRSLRAYRCACGYWHLGNLNPGVIQGRYSRHREEEAA